jgi:hypothetical protein
LELSSQADISKWRRRRRMENSLIIAIPFKDLNKTLSRLLIILEIPRTLQTLITLTVFVYKTLKSHLKMGVLAMSISVFGV